MLFFIESRSDLALKSIDTKAEDRGFEPRLTTLSFPNSCALLDLKFATSCKAKENIVRKPL